MSESAENIERGHRALESIAEAFGGMEDPRVEDNQDHRLISILFPVLCAVLCGATSLDGIVNYVEAKEDFLLRVLNVGSLPSRSTIWWFLVRLDPEVFRKAFQDWLPEISQLCGRQIAIDGKRLRGVEARRGASRMIHVVHAWASDAGLLLGQIKTDEKSNEITAIPKLLELIDIEGAVITIDAMGCQTKIARVVKAKLADYVFALKGNQETLEEEVKTYFSGLSEKELANLDHFEEVDKGHGRIEGRKVYVESRVDWFEDLDRWKGLNAFVMVISTRIIDGEESVERRFYISSLTCTAKEMAGYIRRHWSVENNLHWCLDVIFREDESQVYTGHAPENLAVIRRISLNLINLDTTEGKGMRKNSVKAKQQRAGWDDDFLLKVVSQGSDKSF